MSGFEWRRMSQPKHADDKRRALHNYFLRSQTRSQSNTPSLTTNSTLSSSSNSALISPVDFEALSFEPQPELLCSKSKPGVDSIIASMRQIGEELDRTPTNLQKAGYNPVWTSVLGYPGEIPEDLKEFICPEVEQGNYLVNQLSSTFWLKGDKFLNELIRDPGHKLQDNIYSIQLTDGRHPKLPDRVSFSFLPLSHSSSNPRRETQLESQPKQIRQRNRECFGKHSQGPKAVPRCDPKSSGEPYGSILPCSLIIMCR